MKSIDSQKLASLVVSEANDNVTVREYGHGFLVAMPLTYWDDDRVTLFVEPFEDGYKVTDRGSTAVRLHMTGINAESPRVADSWKRSVAALNLFNPGDEELELAHFTSRDRLGESIFKVAEACLRVDQLRWLHSPQAPSRFHEKVVRHLLRSIGDRAIVRPNAPLRLRHGRTKYVTASVGPYDEDLVYVQAVGGTSRDARERAVEHCSHLFHLADGVQRDQRLAVVAGKRDEWNSYYIDTLSEFAEVAFYGERGQLDGVLRRSLSSVGQASRSAKSDRSPFGPGSALPVGDGGSPNPAFIVKGNAASKRYHGPDSPYYSRTRAEVWFVTVEAAEAAGFRRGGGRRRTKSTKQDGDR